MHRIFGCLFLLLSTLASTSACSGSSGSTVSSSTTSTAPSGDLSGRWSGWSTTTTGFSGSFTADLQQDGALLTGTFRAPGGCIAGGKIDGTIAGDRVDATVTSGNVMATFTLTVSSEDHLDGTFEMPAAGACAAQRGSVSMTR